MSTVVVELELSDPDWPRSIVAGGWILVVLRYGGRPVAQVTMRSRAGEIDVPRLVDALLVTPCGSLWRAWIEALAGRERSLPPAAPAAIAICTRDRPEVLEHCLDALAALPDDGQEILVVDSASHGDGVARVVERRSGVRRVRLERPGLDRARNAALAATDREFVAFVDDDATVEPDWLRALTAPFADPQVAATTGLVLPQSLASPAQEWFERHFGFGRGYERRRLRRGALPLEQSWRAGVGASFAVRRKTVCETLGGFDETLDVGTPTYAGGDNDLFARLLAIGQEIEYRPDAVAWHRHGRSTVGLGRKFFGYGVSWTAFLRRLDRQLGSHRTVIELLRSLARQSGRVARSLAGDERRLPASLLLCEAAGWLWGLIAGARRRGSPPPLLAAARATANRRTEEPAATPSQTPMSEVADIDLLAGVAAAARAIEARPCRAAVVRLGGELVGVLSAPGDEKLDGSSLGRGLAGELAIGLIAAIAASGRIPAAAPPPPLPLETMGRWLATLSDEPTTEADGHLVERFLAREERYRLRHQWLARADDDIARLDAWNHELEEQLNEQRRRFEAVQESLSRLEAERLELEHREPTTTASDGAEGDRRAVGVPA